jgi:hypothetical protein
MALKSLIVLTPEIAVAALVIALLILPVLAVALTLTLALVFGKEECGR